MSSLTVGTGAGAASAVPTPSDITQDLRRIGNQTWKNADTPREKKLASQFDRYLQELSQMLGEFDSMGMFNDLNMPQSERPSSSNPLKNLGLFNEAIKARANTREEKKLVEKWMKRQDDYARIVSEMTARNMLGGDEVNGVQGSRASAGAQQVQNRYIHIHQHGSSKCAPARSCDRTSIEGLWNRGSCRKKGIDFETFRDRLLNLLLEALFGKFGGRSSPGGDGRNFGIQRCCSALRFV